MINWRNPVVRKLLKRKVKQKNVKYVRILPFVFKVFIEKKKN